MTNGEPETVVSASLQKIKSIKNPIFFNFFYLIKSETSDSFVNHFDGHFAYLKTLDFYFNVAAISVLCICHVQRTRYRLFSCLMVYAYNSYLKNKI